MQRVLVERGNIREIGVAAAAAMPLDEGQARLKVRRFALTANNVTYAATGEVIGYWQFFPAGDAARGIVPVWGVAEVTESRSEALAPGEMLYGFWPMADELVMVPEARGERTVIDTAPHRADLPAVYNAYSRMPADVPEGDQHLRALLQPLIATSYLLFDWLIDNDLFGAEQVIVGSASSKTGLGLCLFLDEPEGRDWRIVGLTGAGNRGFVERLGACDEVLSYAEVERLRLVPSVYVDMAGDAEVKARLHHHLGENVRHSAAVGTSHWDSFAPPQPMPGAKPRFFFAPSQIAKRREEWGPGVIEGRIEQATTRVAARSKDWMRVEVHRGWDAAVGVYREIASGRVDPAVGHVVEV